MNFTAFVGSYTDESLAGIHILDVDASAGAMRPLGILRGIENPTYLAVNRAGTRLYTVRGLTPGAAPETNGAVAAYAIEGATLTLLNCCATRATIPCYLALDLAERTLVYAEYAQGHAGAFALNDDGSIDATSEVAVQHTGRGPNPLRQERAHAHCAEVTPDGRWLCVCDLGLDQVVVYDLADWRRGLRARPELAIRTAPGAGPRQLRFHPNGRLVFLLNELDSTVLSLRYTGAAFETVDTLSALPDGFDGESKAAAVRVSPDGRFLFTSNRGHDSLATFAVDTATGRIRRLAISPLSGRFPRDFNVVPDGNWLLVGHKRSDELVLYAFDRTSGRIEPRGPTYPMHHPTCVVFHPARPTIPEAGA